VQPADGRDDEVEGHGDGDAVILQDDDECGVLPDRDDREAAELFVGVSADRDVGRVGVLVGTAVCPGP
jgi:hypothetical protein